ncbi:putative diguanylate cyclase AdrA [compost metagenome]
MIDIDHFKEINDSFGHIVGDEVLQQLSQELKRLLDQYELAGRYGGDEFCVILPTLPLHKAEALMEQLREALQQYRHPQVPELRVGLSIGLARYQSLYKDALDWLDDADKALYIAKHTGRNTISVALTRTATDNADA